MLFIIGPATEFPKEKPKGAAPGSLLKNSRPAKIYKYRFDGGWVVKTPIKLTRKQAKEYKDLIENDAKGARKAGHQDGADAHEESGGLILMRMQSEGGVTSVEIRVAAKTDAGKKNLGKP